jgi:hypothetical protein
VTLQPGLRAAFWFTATEADAAVALSVAGEVPVLVTPRVLGLAERTTVAAVAGALAGATTGGTRGRTGPPSAQPDRGRGGGHAVLEG